MKNLLDREGNVDGSWVQTAFNEILSTIYSCEMSTEDFDKIIDDMGLLVEEKAKSFNNIKINWQQIDNTIVKKSTSIAMNHREFSDMMNSIAN